MYIINSNKLKKLLFELIRLYKYCIVEHSYTFLFFILGGYNGKTIFS